MIGSVDDRFTADLDDGPALDHADTRDLLESVRREKMARRRGVPDETLRQGRRDLDAASSTATWPRSAWSLR